MGVFQVEDGIKSAVRLAGYRRLAGHGRSSSALCLSYVMPLMVDLERRHGASVQHGHGARRLPDGLRPLAGPTHQLMGGIVESFGTIFRRRPAARLRHLHLLRRAGRATGSSPGPSTYMVWWLAWAPFVGVFIARISKGRTIREFLLGVVLVPTASSRSSGSASSAAWASGRSCALEGAGDPGGGPNQRQRHHLLPTGHPAARLADHRRHRRRGLSLHRHQRGQRGLRAGDVLDRRRPQPLASGSS